MPSLFPCFVLSVLSSLRLALGAVIDTARPGRAGGRGEEGEGGGGEVTEEDIRTYVPVVIRSYLTVGVIRVQRAS